jgi:hypothetical protein
MAKKPSKKVAEQPQEQVHPKKGLDIKVKLDKTESGRVTVTVSLLQDGVVVATDYDFVQV